MYCYSGLKLQHRILKPSKTGCKMLGVLGPLPGVHLYFSLTDKWDPKSKWQSHKRWHRHNSYSSHIFCTQLPFSWWSQLKWIHCVHTTGGPGSVLILHALNVCKHTGQGWRFTSFHLMNLTHPGSPWQLHAFSSCNQDLVSQRTWHSASYPVHPPVTSI